MIFNGWFIWCILFTFCLSSWSLEDSQQDIAEVKCSQGLSDCTVQDVFPHIGPKGTANIKKLNVEFGTNCEGRKKCLLYLVIDAELDINPDLELDEEDNSGVDEEEYSEQTENTKASVTVCYQLARTLLSTCKKVEFTVNASALAHQNKPKISMTVTNPDGFPYSSTILVKSKGISQPFVAPSVTDVCSKKLYPNAQMCQVPTVRSMVNPTSGEMKLSFDDTISTIPSLCIQYEKNGSCQESSVIGKQKTLPPYSLAPCMCFQSWYKDDQSLLHSQYCPFQNKSVIPPDVQQNMWKNISIKVDLKKPNNKSTMLLWNVSAPCMLEGEVFLCHMSDCMAENKPRQQLENGIWNQNSQGMWEKKGDFQDIDEFSQCILVKLKGHVFEPICLDGVSFPVNRWRWTLLIVAVMLLVCIALLVSHYHHDCVKKWAWNWRLGGFVKVVRRGHVVLMSPPDVDDSVSESVSKLGDLLYSKGFSVTVEQWCRREQSNLGPLPWLHSVLLKHNGMDIHFVLALTPSILNGTANLADMHTNLFTATLFLMQAKNELKNCCVLVRFDSQPKQRQSTERILPPMFHGLPLFHIPSQIKSLLTELSVIKPENGTSEWA